MLKLKPMTLAHLAKVIERFKTARILCIGDLMLDRFVYGAVERVSPEAPIPVLRVMREAAMLGGAGNVARNVAALGGQVTLIGVAGDDEAGSELTRAMGAIPGIDPCLITVKGRKTTVKTRYVAGGQQLLRSDYEQSDPVDAASAAQILEIVRAEMSEADVVILSDYAKGVLSPAVLTGTVEAAHRAGKRAIADPKSARFATYRGCDLLTPNAKELAAATGMAVASDEEVLEAATAACEGAGIPAMLVTRSEKGMALVRPGAAAPLLLATEAREVFDVSGAGDTVLATLGLGLGAGLSLEDAARIANAAAGIVVAKAGTAVAHPEELAGALHASDMKGAEAKIRTRTATQDLCAGWRAKGLKIGFTNGCFDLIHPGHVSLLKQARAACDRLIVGLNTDESVKRLKGPTRPVNAEHARAIVLAALETVDAVVLFAEDTPMALIETIRPDVLVKGADYTVDTVVGADFVRSYGGRIVLAGLTPGQSTTNTIARMARET